MYATIFILCMWFSASCVEMDGTAVVDLEAFVWRLRMGQVMTLPGHSRGGGNTDQLARWVPRKDGCGKTLLSTLGLGGSDSTRAGRLLLACLRAGSGGVWQLLLFR